MSTNTNDPESSGGGPSGGTSSPNTGADNITNSTGGVRTSMNVKQNPPKFIEGSNYDNWKKKLEMWGIVTGYLKSEQAVMVMLTSFENNSKAERILSEISVEDLNCDTGLKNLLAKLDETYKKDKIDDAYDSYKKFIQWKKPIEMSMQDFIVEFEHRYHHMNSHDIKLPDSILTFILIDASTISASGRQLAFTVANDMKYETMKSALKRIFSDEPGSCSIKTHYDTDAEACYLKRSANRRTQFSRTDVTSMPHNPRNKQGEISRCAVCESKMHWASKCPHNPRRKSVHLTECKESDSEIRDNSDTDSTSTLEEIVNDAFLTANTENEIYVAETTGCAVLDTACTKTVCGEKWFNRYIAGLHQAMRDDLDIKNGGASFKFGDGKRVVSIKNVKLPAVIAGSSCHVNTDVVKADLPLLLSKSTLKKMKTNLNLEHDEAMMLGKPVKLLLTTNGHYCVNIHPVMNKNFDCINDNQIFLSSKENSELNDKDIVKLHKQFGHASSDNIIKLLRNTGKTVKEDESRMIRDIVHNCEICALYKKPTPRPAVSLPRSQDVNVIVAMDLHQLEPNLWFFHMIDEFSRFSNAVIIRSKVASVIVQKFLQYWVSIFGSPKKVLSDNGREFDNEKFRDMCGNFNISVVTTPAYSPWCNGICERHNYILSDILLKVRKDTGCDWETGLAWALSAKNSLINHNGFSPNQIMFGRQPNLPSILNDKLPALEGMTISERVGQNISSLYAARRAFAAADSSGRIRKALRCKTRPFNGHFEIGELVYFKRTDTKEWKGPAKVLGQDGVVIFLRYGAQFVRAHASRVQRINEDSVTESEKNDDVSDGEVSDRAQDYGPQFSNNENDEHYPSDQSDNISVSTQSHSQEAELHSDTNNSPNISRSEISLKKSQVVQFTKDDTLYEAEILGRAGKASGKYANCFNIKYRSPSDRSNEWVNFDHVKDLVIVPQVVEQPVSESMASDNQSTDQVLVAENVDFMAAKETEIKNWIENEVFEEQEYSGQKCISLKWVCSLKQTKAGIQPKARLVARGFEDPDLDKIEKDSPTCCKSALRTVIAVTMQKGWKLQSMDIKTAFLQGEKLNRDVYVYPPKEANCSPGKIWKLKKCVYGLSDASLQWYGRVKRFMVENGGKMTKSDPSVFCWHDSDKQLQGLFAVHVDDFLWAGNEILTNDILAKLRATFKIGSEESEQFKYLGLEIKHEKSAVVIDQNKYIAGLEPLKIESKKRDDEKLTKDEQNTLRSRIGQFLWISSQSRPDISYDVCVLATNFKIATIHDLRRANKVLRRLKSDNTALKLQHLGHSSNLKLVCYADASFANLCDEGSQAGNLIFLVGQNDKCNLLCWESKRIKRVVKSSLAAETLAASEGIDNAMYVASLISELWNGSVDKKKIPIEVVTDNLSLHNALKSNKQITDKRLRVDLAAIKEMLSRKEISRVKWVEGKYQLADKLTKAGASSSKLLDVLNDGQLKNI